MFPMLPLMAIAAESSELHNYLIDTGRCFFCETTEEMEWLFDLCDKAEIDVYKHTASMERLKQFPYMGQAEDTNNFCGIGPLGVAVREVVAVADLMTGLEQEPIVVDADELMNMI